MNLTYSEIHAAEAVHITFCVLAYKKLVTHKAVQTWVCHSPGAAWRPLRITLSRQQRSLPMEEMAAFESVLHSTVPCVNNLPPYIT